METPIKLLGIDWGEKRIGLAMAEDTTKIATPLGVVFSLEEIIKIIHDENVDLLVVGEPKSLSGGDKLSEKFGKFLLNLKEATVLKIELVDERLSSKAADSLSGGKKDKAERDALAAMIILQSYLDKI